MITISLCMIVKNEERILARCLDTVADLVEEMIIVDTGSTDRTKEIAARYTDKIYDFEWTDDFSAARNYAFSKATREYIYSADADEVLNPENRERFRVLKENLLPEIELVQMKYGNQLQHGSVYNFDEEYRPKLFKRQREFVWEGPIHETVRTNPVIYDSDIVITHMQEESHAARDLANFRRHTARGIRLDKRLHHMYARELYMAGEKEDFLEAADFFQASASDTERDSDEIMEACLVAARAARLADDMLNFFRYTTKIIAAEGCSEVCCELGSFYEAMGNPDEAVIWYYNAVYETTPILKLTSAGKEPLEGLVRCYRALHMPEQAAQYQQALSELGG
ncbi:MAG: glycosyltransferase family 2 protein [Roseburia sp.]|nr:glycosyltransferase family 2 protein [Roseburia sp.]